MPHPAVLTTAGAKDNLTNHLHHPILSLKSFEFDVCFFPCGFIITGIIGFVNTNL